MYCEIAMMDWSIAKRAYILRVCSYHYLVRFECSISYYETFIGKQGAQTSRFLIEDGDVNLYHDIAYIENIHAEQLSHNSPYIVVLSIVTNLDFLPIIKPNWKREGF